MKVYSVSGNVSDHAIVDSGLTIRDHLWKQIGEAAKLFQSLPPDVERINCRKVTANGNSFGHFAHFNILGCFNVVFSEALENAELRYALGKSGELRRLAIEGQAAFLWNVLRRCEAVDYSHSQIYSGTTDYPVFIPSALPASGFFRVPEAWSRVYLVEPASGGFLRMYRNLRLSGLCFEERPLSRHEDSGSGIR